jgi:hypothetical protein
MAPVILTLIRRSTMFTMFGHIFAAIAMIAHSVLRGATAIDHYAKWAEEEARIFERSEAAIRNAKLTALEASIAANVTPIKAAA